MPHAIGRSTGRSSRLAQWRAAPAADPRGLLDYLKTWLVEHIMKTNRELARQIPGPG